MVGLSASVHCDGRPVSFSSLQTRCDICCTCHSFSPFIPNDSACPGKNHRSLCSWWLCMAVCQSGQPITDSTYCRRFIESVRMTACVICASRWEASHCITCVTATTSNVRLKVMILWAPLSSCADLPPCLTVNPQPDWYLVTEPSV